MFKQDFRELVFFANTDGSGKAASYVRVLGMFVKILARQYLKSICRESMWNVAPLQNSCALNKRQDKVWCHEGVKMVLQ